MWTWLHAQAALWDVCSQSGGPVWHTARSEGNREKAVWAIPCLFFPLHFRFRERKVHRQNFRSCGTFIPWNIRSCGTFVPRSECSKNFRSMEHSLPWNFRSSGANVPRTFVPMKLSFHENEYSKNLRSKCPKTLPKLAINRNFANEKYLIIYTFKSDQKSIV